MRWRLALDLGFIPVVPRISQAELAKRLGRSQSFVAKIEAGERRLDVVEFVAWARALKADPEATFRRFVHW